MHLIPGFLLFLLGFAMLTGGVALFVCAPVRFNSGRTIPQDLARSVGIVLVSFFPAVIAANVLLRLIDPEQAVPPAIINWPLAVGCLVMAAVKLWRGMAGKTRPAVPAAPPPAAAPEAVSLPATLDFDGPAAASPPPGPRPAGKARSISPER